MKNLTKTYMQKAVNHVVGNIPFKPHEKTLLKAYARQGLAELRHSFGTFYQEGRSIAEVDQGMWGKTTSYELTLERQGNEQEPKNLLQEEQEKLREQLTPEPNKEKELEK